MGPVAAKARLACGGAALALLLFAVPALASVCGGRTDDTRELNALLRAGGSVTLPAGHCLVSGTLLMPAGTVLRGAGEGVTVIQAAPGADDPTLAIDGDHASVAALTVNGGASGKDEKAPGIFVRPGVAHVRIEGVEVTAAGANGIKVSGSNVDVIGNTVHDNWISGVYVVGKLNKQGLPVPRAEHVRVVGNTVSHNVLGLSRTGRPGDGIDIDRMTSDCLVKDNRVIGNDIILFENGQQADASGSTRSSGHIVTGNTITDSLANGIDVAGAESDFTITGNTIRNIRGFGIVVNGPVDGGVIRGNTIEDVEKNGIVVDNWIGRHFPNLAGRPQKIDVSGNTVEATGDERGGPIAVRVSAPDVQVSGNTVR